MEEKIYTTKRKGMAVLLTVLFVYLIAITGTVFGAVKYEDSAETGYLVLVIVSVVVLSLGWFPLIGLRVLKPQEALVLTLFGKYVGTIREAGFYFVNPFCTAINPAATTKLAQSGDIQQTAAKSAFSISADGTSVSVDGSTSGKKISLKAMTLSNGRQKINDCLGNPVEIGIAVIWRVMDTAKAVFNVDNYKEYLSLQCDSALRNIVRVYPYDVAPNVDTTGDGVADEGSLRGSAEVVAGRIRDEIQSKVNEAGLEIVEARITYLAYAPEIASVMLQRQQASAIIDARKMIVDGAVGMVEMALEELNKNRSLTWTRSERQLWFQISWWFCAATMMRSQSSTREAYTRWQRRNRFRSAYRKNCMPILPHGQKMTFDPSTDRSNISYPSA